MQEDEKQNNNREIRRVGRSHTQESSHVKTSLHLNATDAVGQHCFGMAMHYAVYSRILLEYLAVDATFFVSLRNVLTGASRSAPLLDYGSISKTSSGSVGKAETHPPRLKER